MQVAPLRRGGSVNLIKRIILAGDHRQLPATAHGLDPAARQMGLYKSNPVVTHSLKSAWFQPLSPSSINMSSKTGVLSSKAGAGDSICS
jgi:hypothetical protein